MVKLGGRRYTAAGAGRFREIPFCPFSGKVLTTAPSSQRAASLAAQKNVVSPSTRSLLARIRRLLLSSPRLMLDSLRLLLPTAIFFIKFLEWWYSPNSPARSLSTSPKGQLFLLQVYYLHILKELGSTRDDTVYVPFARRVLIMPLLCPLDM